MDLTIRPFSADDWPRLCAIDDAARKDESRAAGLADAFLTLEQTAENEGLFDGTVEAAEVHGEIPGFIADARAHDDPGPPEEGAGL